MDLCAGLHHGKSQNTLPCCITPACLGTTQFHTIYLLMLQTQSKSHPLCSPQLFLVTLWVTKPSCIMLIFWNQEVVSLKSSWSVLLNGECSSSCTRSRGRNQMDSWVWKEHRRYTQSPSWKPICPIANEDGAFRHSYCLGTFQGQREEGTLFVDND